MGMAPIGGGKEGMRPEADKGGPEPLALEDEGRRIGVEVKGGGGGVPDDPGLDCDRTERGEGGV